MEADSTLTGALEKSSDPALPPEAESHSASDETFFNADFEKLAARARAADVVFREVEWGEKPKFWYTAAELDFPRGASVRTVRFQSEEVPRVLDLDFEKYRFVPRYAGLVHTTTGLVECALTWSQSLMNRGSVTSIWQVPGVDVDETSPLKTGEKVASYEIPSGWRLSVAGSDVRMEVSPASEPFGLLFGRFGMGSGVTFKIQHDHGPSGPRAGDLLGTFGEDWMLDLELKYHLGTTLAREGERRPSSNSATSVSTTPPDFPKLQYQADAGAFYWYGVSAGEFPLLQYLAFYQVLEYFFSSFTRSATLSRMRSQLKDPAFELTSDQAMGMLIETTRTVHAGLKHESDQLRQTLFECIEPDALRLFIRSDPALVEHFLGAKQKVKGTRTLRLDSDDDDIRNQVSERIYKVRNRIVHTKSGADEFGLELLLPISDEMAFLAPEVKLVRWLAQRALIHGARIRPQP